MLQLVCLQCYSQLVNIDHYSTADGLADNRITVIKKDRDGFMWFGSWAGISRFDGYHFTTFKSYPGDNSPLKSNRIDEILEDGGGLHLWLGAYDRRIYRFDKRTGTFSSMAQLLDDPSFDKLAITKILSVQDSRVWLKTEKDGLIMINHSSGLRPEYTSFSLKEKVKSRLLSNNINIFHLDINHNAWLTSPKGLNVLELGKDGKYEAKNIRSLGRQIVTDLTEGKNTMLLGTQDGKLIKLNRKFDVLNSSVISLGTINKVIESRKTGTIYCSTSAGELIAVDGRNVARVIYNTNDLSALGYIYEDATGVLWIGSQRYGVIRFDPAQQKADYFYPQKDYKIIPRIRSFSAFEDQRGKVYINFDGQVSFYNPSRKTMELLSSKLNNYPRSKNLVRFFYDESGILWLGSGYEGIDKLVFQDNPFSQILTRPNSSERESNEIRGLFADNQNRLWAGTKRGEVFLYQDGKGTPQYFSESFSNNAGVYFIKGDQQGSVWLATKGNGVFQAALGWQNGNQMEFSHYLPNSKNRNAISSNSIYCILEDHMGRIWAGSYEQGLILIEILQGKTVFKTLFNSFLNYPSSDFRKIRHLAQDKKGVIWVATTDGLIVFDPKSSSPNDYKFRTYKKEPGNIKSLGGNDIQYVYPDSKGRIWVLTTTGGLNLAVGDNPLKNLSFINYSRKDGLPSDFLLSCIEDKQKNLWIATQNGLSKLSHNKNKFQNFGKSDGLEDVSFSEASVAMMKSGELVFGTTAGLLSFKPESIRSPKVSAPLVLTNLQINSEDILPKEGSPLNYLINYTKRVELEHDQNMISLDFAVLDFHATNKQTYASRLVGYDEVWRDTEGQRRATFTKLPPGKYVFEVKSLNDELYKHVPFRSLEIVIHPPLWRTWWAYVIYFLVSVVAIVLIRRNEITLLKLKQRVEVEHQVAELKVEFFNQISHELRTPLTMIIGPSEDIQEHEKLSERGNEYIAIVLANARRMLHLVNQVLNLRKVKSGKDSLHQTDVNVLSVVKQLVFSFKETIDKRKLRVEIVADFSKLTGWLDEHKFEIIIYNLIGNAIKFSEDGSPIIIKAAKNEEQGTFTISVVDTGSGVSDEELTRIFDLYFEGGQQSQSGKKGTGIGLALSKELVQLHGGQISANHNVPKGLKVIVELPLFLTDKVLATDDGNFDSPVYDSQFVTNGETEKNSDPELPVLLIVEDHDDMRNFLKGKFADFYRVETAKDGEDGVLKAKRLLPSLILSDIMMPKKDGIQLLDEVKNDPTTSHIPVILLSAKFSIESQIEGLKYGADYYLPKPFNWILLKTAVDNILKQRQLAFQRLQDKEEVTLEEIGITAYDRMFLNKLLQTVEERLNDSEFNIDDVAESLGMSRSTFYRKFKSLTDTTPIDFVRDTRLRKAKELLDAGEDNISVAAYSVGFSSPKYFTLCFKSRYEQTPSAYLKSIRNKGKG